MSETDTKACPVNEAQALFQDLDKPSLHALSYALRHPDTWPKGFIWNYRNCEQCAMGLAHSLWAEQVARADLDTGASIMGKAFAMPYAEAQKIFLAREGGHYAPWLPGYEKTTGKLWWKETRGVRGGRKSYDQVTPEMVADQIDKYLTTAE